MPEPFASINIVVHSRTDALVLSFIRFDQLARLGSLPPTVCESYADGSLTFGRAAHTFLA
jgi:hypothetical protein